MRLPGIGKTKVFDMAAWFHVQVRNLGGRPAHHCSGFIDSVEVLEDGQFQPHAEFRGRLRLPWANTGGEVEATLQPSEHPTHRLDVFYAVERVQWFHLPVAGGHGCRTEFPKGTYRLTVTVESPDAASSSCRLLVDYQRDWDHIDIKQTPLSSFVSVQESVQG